MEVHSWIVGQIIIDVLMAFVLLWFIFFHFRKSGSGKNLEEEFRKSEAILSEMRQITQVLENNLEKKRRLSSHILEQLDEGLKKADESRRQIENIIREYGGNMAHESDPLRDTDRTRSSIKALLQKGMTRAEISRHLGISTGEIDLLLKLQT